MTDATEIFVLYDANYPGGAPYPIRERGECVTGRASYQTETVGTGAGYLVNSGSLAVGDTDIWVDTGTGTILAGDLIKFASSQYYYTVETALTGGKVVIQNGLIEAVANNVALHVVAPTGIAVTHANDLAVLNNATNRAHAGDPTKAPYYAFTIDTGAADGSRVAAVTVSSDDDLTANMNRALIAAALEGVFRDYPRDGLFTDASFDSRETFVRALLDLPNHANWPNLLSGDWPTLGTMTTSTTSERDRSYRRGNIVSTPTEDGTGIPTAGIMKTDLVAGSGRYTKFADGSMQAWADLTLVYATTSYLEITWTFPVAFINAVDIIVTATPNGATMTPAWNEIGAIRVLSVTTTTCKVRVYRQGGATNFASGDTMDVHAHVHGRWHAYNN